MLNCNFCTLSECIADLKSDFEDNHQPLTDDNQQLQRFCAKLEYLLRTDMKGADWLNLIIIDYYWTIVHANKGL